MKDRRAPWYSWMFPTWFEVLLLAIGFTLILLGKLGLADDAVEDLGRELDRMCSEETCPAASDKEVQEYFKRVPAPTPTPKRRKS